MSTQLIRQWSHDLQTIAETGDEESVSDAMLRLQASLATMEPSDVIAQREGQNFVDALATLKDTLDNVTSVYERKFRLVAKELAGLNKGSAAMGSYQKLSQY